MNHLQHQIDTIANDRQPLQKQIEQLKQQIEESVGKLDRLEPID